MKINGIHHVSALTANAQKNVDFYRQILGLKLVKKTVNQDDPSMYHLFYGDEVASSGTELTFFEIPMLARRLEGTNAITSTGLLVSSEKALTFWEKRFEDKGVQQETASLRGGRPALRFKDPEGQQLFLTVEPNAQEEGSPPVHDDIPAEFAIRGLGPVELTVAEADKTIRVLTDILGFTERAREQSNDGEIVTIFESGNGGAGTEIHVIEKTEGPSERSGRGSVHHVAFRVKDAEELEKWYEKISKAGFTNSGVVERFYFKALYFREPNGILFEISTDGPGFTVDEGVDELGDQLALPPFLEHKRAEIEQRLTPIQSS
ncbi:ring-cleaving dioxygenase [Bacillus safensis]|uniref:ring-cleaving dioxygenase n=1 Tax=Bacillus safensis TaxID=561879 RepID=UPI001BACD751|nr:ring-cleaving dioxygenase [Bacillus safensis]MBR0613247.1 ring-cleaving dioxygenase [Bacillus safensis]MBR0634927.1 ring-cleaving dioxygenase [Bacillus safensis]